MLRLGERSEEEREDRNRCRHVAKLPRKRVDPRSSRVKSWRDDGSFNNKIGKGSEPKMRPLNLDGPVEIEIRIQLRRILESEMFSGSLIQSTILFIVVEAALADEDIKAQHLHDAIYGRTTVSASSTKSNVNLVRSKLVKYYETSGVDDRIRILLPAGRGYQPSFSYNPKSFYADISTDLTESQQKFTFGSLELAEYYYWWMEDKDRLNPDLHLAMARIKLLTAMLQGLLGVRVDDAVKAYRQVTEFAEKAVRCGAKGSWPYRLRILAEIMRVGRNALERNPPELFQDDSHWSDGYEHDLWRAFYSATIGLVWPTSELFDKLVEESPDDFVTNLSAAYFFYGVRCFDRADACLMSIRRDHKSQNDAYHLIQGLVYLELGSFQEAWQEFESIERVIYDADSRSPGKRVIRTISRVPGFEAMTIARWRGVDEARVFLAGVRRDQLRPLSFEAQARVRRTYGELPPVSPRNFQMAVAYMALGQIGRALVYMRRAYWERDVLIQWVSYMPFLDPLRKHQRWRGLFGNGDVDKLYRGYGDFLS